MISIIFIALAAVCNACMQAIIFRFGWSIFKNLKPGFWNEAYITANQIKVKTIGGWKFTAFHCFQSLMILFCAAAVVTHGIWLPSFITWWMEILIYGIVWAGVQPFTYGKIAPKPTG